MQFNRNLFLFAVLCLIPPALVIYRLIRKRREERQLSQAPFTELQRRPPGEALRLKLAELDDDAFMDLSGMIYLPITMVAVLFFLHPTDPFSPLLLPAASLGSSIYFGRRLAKFRQERANYQLGFDGERFVGEELSQLIALQYQVYHDLPFEGFNIDHVLVGPGGVFVVETKARRKLMNGGGKKEFRVTFDGQMLHWPGRSDSHGIDQAKNNAKTLSNWLSLAVGQNIWVTPILTLPGWMVERTVPANGIYVVNPKEIKKVCAAFPATLTEPKIKQICHQLDQKCRISLDD
jgi:hypothetical protein